MIDLSIIFPAFNEAERIVPTLRAFDQFLARSSSTYEIIVVDDGSTDSTVKVIRQLQAEMPQLQLLVSEQNRGKGAAVRSGMLAAKGQIRIFSDADGSTPVSELPKLLTPLNNAEVAICIGSRYLEGAEIIRAQPFFRRVWSRLANPVVQGILLPGIVDPYCGFKAFKAQAAIQIFRECQVDEWSFDLEVLALARKHKLGIAEVPVQWVNDERSRGQVRHLWKEVRNLYQIRKRLRKQRRSS